MPSTAAIHSSQRPVPATDPGTALRSPTRRIVANAQATSLPPASCRHTTERPEAEERQDQSSQQAKDRQQHRMPRQEEPDAQVPRQIAHVVLAVDLETVDLPI